MKAIRTLLLASMAVIFAAPMTAALADPWKDESGHGRYEHRYERHEHRRDAERARWERERRRDYERERRAEFERRRAYEQGREDGYREAAPRNPVDLLGGILGR